VNNQYRKNVGGVLLNHENKIFVGHRNDSLQAWQMPQGGIDEGEEPHAAFLREMKEEIGTDQFDIIASTKKWYRYDFPSDIREKLKQLHKNDFQGQEQLWFLCKINEKTNINIETTHPEFSAYKWASPMEIIADCVVFKKDVYIQVFQEFNLIPH
jgi:putative (di)nucleoside polyphosphate hydrolase